MPSGSPPPREKRSPVQLSGRLPFSQSRISWRKASSGGEKRKSIRKKRHGPGSRGGRDRPAGEPHARYHDAYVRCKESTRHFVARFPASDASRELLLQWLAGVGPGPPAPAQVEDA